MKELLYQIVEKIARIHEKILTLNDAYEYNFSDKQLHFLVVGALGMLLIFLIHPLFKLLANRGHVMVISWIYVFTLILVVTFAIEIGQGITHTGVMDFSDIVFGIGGFFLMFAIFAVVRAIIKGVMKLVRKED